MRNCHYYPGLSVEGTVKLIKQQMPGATLDLINRECQWWEQQRILDVLEVRSPEAQRYFTPYVYHGAYYRIARYYWSGDPRIQIDLNDQLLNEYGAYEDTGSRDVTQIALGFDECIVSDKDALQPPRFSGGEEVASDGEESVKEAAQQANENARRGDRVTDLAAQVSSLVEQIAQVGLDGQAERRILSQRLSRIEEALSNLNFSTDS